MELGDPVSVLRSHESDITALCFVRFEERDFVLSGDASGTLKLWDIALRRLLLSMHPHTTPILTTVQQSNVRCGYVLTHDKIGDVKTWDLSPFIPSTPLDIALERNSAALKLLQGPSAGEIIVADAVAEDNFEAPAFCPVALLESTSSGNDLACVYSEPAGGVYLLEIEENGAFDKKKAEMIKFEEVGMNQAGICMSIALQEQEGTLYMLLGMENGAIYVVDVDLGDTIARRALSQQPVLSIKLQGSSLLVSSADMRLHLYHVDLLERKMEIVAKHASATSSCVDIRADGTIALTCGWDSRIRVFVLPTLTQIAHLDSHKGSLAAVSFNRHNGTFIAGGKDRKVTYFDLYSENFRTKILKHTSITK